MPILDFLLQKAPAAPSGYVQDRDAWIRSLPRHEAVAAGASAGTPSWSDHAPGFRPQEGTAMCTAFAACNAASMLESHETGKRTEFSALELFARSNGTSLGNGIQATMDAWRSGLVLSDDCPWVGPVSDWSPFVVRLMAEYAKACRAKSPPRTAYAAKGLTYVLTDRASMSQALRSSPLLAILNVGRGYWDAAAPYAATGSAHAVVVTDVMEDGRIRIFDSLQPKEGFDGFHYLSKDFALTYAFGVVDLPNGWQATMDEWESGRYTYAKARYGKRYDAGAESAARALLAEARRRNPTHASFLDADWDVYAAAVAYGGYSVADVVNDITSRRRGNGAIFDFNTKR